jgi:hypothetical protein
MLFVDLEGMEIRSMHQGTIRGLLDLLERLKSANIYYQLADHTQGAIMVEISVPGERWEIEFHEDGQIGVEKFVSSGEVRGAETLDDLFRRFSESA